MGLRRIALYSTISLGPIDFEQIQQGACLTARKGRDTGVPILVISGGPSDQIFMTYSVER